MRGDAPEPTDRYASAAPRGRRRLSAVATLAVLALGACGEDDFKNETKPPVAQQLTGVITSSQVTISPDTVGTPEDATQADDQNPGSRPPPTPPDTGLPVRIVIDNQSGDAQEVLLEGEGVKERVGPVIAGDTAILQKTLDEGRYTVSACRVGPGEGTTPRGRGCESGGIGPATLTVGSQRRSGSDRNLLP
jgi:hypothetical protein